MKKASNKDKEPQKGSFCPQGDENLCEESYTFHKDYIKVLLKFLESCNNT